MQGTTERYVVSTVEPYYRVLDTRAGNREMCRRKTLKGALLQAKLLNVGDGKPSIVEITA